MPHYCPGLVGLWRSCPPILHGFTPAEVETISTIGAGLVIAAVIVLAIIVLAIVAETRD